MAILKNNGHQEFPEDPEPTRLISYPAVIFSADTSGLTEPKLVQANWLPVSSIDSMHPTVESIPVAIVQELFNPGKAIEFGAMGKHHITDEDVTDAPPAETFKLPEGTNYIIGHNIDSDWQVLGMPNVKRIDTFAIAKKLWPELDSHRLPALTYFLHTDTARKFAKNPEYSQVELSSCWYLFSCIVDELRDRGALTDGLGETASSFEDVWNISETARSSYRLTWGKMENTPIHEVPPDYKNWLLSRPDLETALRKDLVRGYGEEWPWHKKEAPKEPRTNAAVSKQREITAASTQSTNSVKQELTPGPSPKSGAGDWINAKPVSRNATPTLTSPPKQPIERIAPPVGAGVATEVPATETSKVADKAPRLSLAEKLALRSKPNQSTSTAQNSVQRPRG
jgi:exodeoxyribonuclease X